jgi:nucleotide-binding universal stress UspA family protein
VTILEIIGSHPGPGPDALALYLARQGIRASQVRVPAASGESTALQLTREARQAGGDLLVIGGYGHSRLREMVLGSVTEQMIAQAAMPVFINH